MSSLSQLGLALALVSAVPAAAFAQETQGSRATSPDAEATDIDVQMEADVIINDDANNALIAEGNVVAVYEDRTLRADRVVYNLTTRRVYASGNVQIFDADGTQQFADEVDVDETLGDGYASNFSTRLPAGAVAIARSAIRQADGVNALDKVIYTACPVCEESGGTPTWSLRARRAILDQNSQMISYRDAVLEIAGVPVFYLPYFTHPDPNSERRSGLLVPRFGTSSSLGAFYQQPYHQVLSPSSDITVSPALYSNVNPLLAIDYRKRFYSGQLRIEASATNEREFDSDGEKFGDSEWRSHIYAQGRFAANETWDWGFGLERASEDLYTRRYRIDGEGDQRGIYSSQPRRLLSQLYAVGQDRDFYADAALISIQGLRAEDDDGALPTIAPLAFAEKTFDLGGYGLVAVNTSIASLVRETGFDSQRVSVGADWRQVHVLPGGFVAEPFAEMRGDYYALDEDLSGKADVTRLVGTVGGTLAWPLVRTSPSMSIIVEPKALLAYGPTNPNDEPIPIEDSLFFEMDESSLYDASAIPGYDLYEGGARVALGVSATASWNSGLQARAVAGRRWREDADPAFSALSNLDGTSSDWVGSVGFSFNDAYSFDARVRLDDDDFNVNRIDVRSAVNVWRVNAAVRYFRFDKAITADGRGQEGVDMSGQFRVTDHISLVYSQLRDIAGTPIALRNPFTSEFLRDPVTNEILIETRPRDLSRSIGVAWSDECSRFEVVFTRSEAVDRSIGRDDTLQFRFTLLSLGAVGGQ